MKFKNDTNLCLKVHGTGSELLKDFMQFYSESLNLHENTFNLLRDIIHDRLGLFYKPEKRDILADKLSSRVMEKGFDSFLDYYYLLKYDEAAEEEWKQVMDALSVQETFFWREVDQISTLVNVLVPQFFLKPRIAPLRIWCAACATGEEPLTIAMALNEAGWFQRSPIDIFASDASSIAIEKAKAGVYRERSFRNLSPELRSKYFSQTSNGWRVSGDLHCRVNWDIVNLMDEPRVSKLAVAPFIFCRNVFIYFSQQTIRKTVQTFYQHMPDSAYLFVAAAESLLKVTTDFELKDIGGAFVYVKGNKG